MKIKTHTLLLLLAGAALLLFMWRNNANAQAAGVANALTSVQG